MNENDDNFINELNAASITTLYRQFYGFLNGLTD